MAGINLNTIKNFGRMQYTNYWDMVITRPPTGVTGVDWQKLSFRCSASGIPEYTDSAPVEQDLRYLDISRSGKFKPNSPLTFTFVEAEDMAVRKAFKKLREATFDPVTGAVSEHKNIIFEATIYQLNQDKQPIWFYRLKECLSQGWGGGGELGGDAAILQPTWTVGFKWFLDGEV